MKKLPFLFLILVVLLSACSTHRKAIKTPLKQLGVSYLIDKLDSNQLKYNNISSKFSASYTLGSKTTSFKGTIRIKKDSMIWLSIAPALGIELFRVQLTPDSVKFLNRLESSYFAGSFNYLNQLVNANINYQILQSVLLGNDFSTHDPSLYKAGLDNKQYKLSSIEKYRNNRGIIDSLGFNLVQHIWLNPETFKISKHLIKEKKQKDKQKKIEVLYDDFKEINEQIYPRSILFTIVSKAAKDIELSVNYTKTNLDQAIRFPFRIPSKYTPIK